MNKRIFLLMAPYKNYESSYYLMLLTAKNIAATQSTPEVTLDPSGLIIIKGRSMYKKAAEFYKPIEDWINMYIYNPADMTRVDIYAEYFNCANSIIFMSLLKKISNVRLRDKEFVINWHYEEDDEDIMSQGENISFILNIPINLIMISESIDERE